MNLKMSLQNGGHFVSTTMCICIWWIVFVFGPIFVIVFVFVCESRKKYMYVFDETYLTPALLKNCNTFISR